MRTEFLNNGNPLPTGHPHAGEIGVIIDFEDGRPATQRVYAADKDALLSKAFSMYGNSQARLTEVKATVPRTPRETATPTTPAKTELSVEQRMQLTSDLNDPAKAGRAVVELIRAETGVDHVANAELARRKAATQQFVDNNPDFVPGPSGALVRDRCAAQTGDITVEGLQQAYDSLKAEGLIDSRQMEHTPATPGLEPSAQQPQAPRGTATSYRPSTIGNGGRAPAAPKLTYEDVLRISETPEYEERLRNEPGFQQKVNEACEEFENRSKRRAG